MSTYTNLDPRVVQDDAILYDCIISILYSDGLVKVPNRSEDYHWEEWESGVLLIKLVLDESELQINATVMKENDILVSLPELMMRLGHNVSKFNSQVLTVTRSLKRNGSPAPYLLHQLFSDYLA